MQTIVTTPQMTRHQCQMTVNDDGRLIAKSRALTDADVHRLRQKEFLSIEESQLLLIRMLDEEYQKP